MARYSAVLTPDRSSGFVVEFPDLPWAITQGESETECLERAAGVVIATLEELIRRRAPRTGQQALDLHRGRSVARAPDQRRA